MSIEKEINQHGEIKLTDLDRRLKVTLTPRPYVYNYQLQIEGIGDSYLCWSKAKAKALRDILNQLPLDD
jgi:hypothetical protein